MPRLAEDNGGGRRRRRTSALFRPGSALSSLTPIHSDGSSDSLLKKKRRPATFFIPSTPDSDSRSSKGEEEEDGPDALKHRPRILTKPTRPTSIFGSLRSMRLTDEEEQLTTTTTARRTSRDSSIAEEERSVSIAPGTVVLHHGEVQATGGMFRKRKEYLVLTDSHLMRFKSASRAAEAFPALPMLLSRSESMRHASMQSGGSASDFHSAHSHSSSEGHLGVPLHHVVAVFRLDDGRPFFSIEVAHFDEDTGHATSMNLQLNDPSEADLWLTCIRGAATKARLLRPTPFLQRSVEYLARMLEQERDYDPNNFRMFKVVQRASNKSSSRSSTDDLSKLTSTICYLVIGIHRLHLIPLRKMPRSSSTTLSDMGVRQSFGLLNLVSLHMRTVDDAMELAFRLPVHRQQTIHLASSASAEAAIAIRHAAEYLRPQWLEQPFIFQVPRELEDSIIPVNPDQEDNGCFDRTLTAYCAAFEVDTSNIRYTINYDVEDAPQFTLLPTASPRRSTYSVLELLAVLRTLRYNETFHSISFHGIRLDNMHQLHDAFGIDQIAWANRSGVLVDIQGLGQKSVLIQDLQAIALKSKKLRRMNFTDCISRKPQDDEGGARDPGCEIVEALFPLCRRQLTNLDWIVLNGIELGETDLDYLVDAAVERACHLRALEISRCGLTDRSLQLILNAMVSQDNTLESIDISGNLARLSPATFQSQIGHFGYIRKLNLSRVHRTSGPEPLVAPETILTWRLEELHLSETPINEQTVDSISAYLASRMSDTLRQLRLNQCGLTGQDVAVFLRSMSRRQGEARDLHLHVSENRLERDHNELVTAIAQGYSPSHLTMRMVEYQKEDHFRELVLAIKQNKTLKYLDISKASLPYDASHETCEALQQLFTENETLEELDISGEYAHLEVAKFGIGLNHALTGLKRNRALKVLRIEYQKLGLQGASTLSSVLEENSTLREIYCEYNDISLQAMTILVGGLSKNHSVLFMPRLDSDRLASLQKLEKEIQSIRNDPAVNNNTKSSSTMRRTIATVNKHTKLSSSSSSSSSGSSAVAAAAAAANAAASYSEQDIREALRLMNDKWDRQVGLMQKYLQRNYALVHGIVDVDGDGVGSTTTTTMIKDEEEKEEGRPTTGRSSFSGMLEKAALDRTPTVEADDGLANAGVMKYGGIGYSYAAGGGGGGAGMMDTNVMNGGRRYSVEERRYDSSSRPTTATTLTGSSTATITTNGSRPTTATLTTGGVSGGGNVPSITAGNVSEMGNGGLVGGKGTSISGNSPRKGSGNAGQGTWRKELHI